MRQDIIQVVPSPDLAGFLELCDQGALIPVVADVLADLETPLSAYWKLAHDGIHSFLLESVTGGEQLARYSVIGFRPRSVMRTVPGGMVRKTPDGATRIEYGHREDPLDILGREMPGTPVAIEGLPKFIGGAVGILSYDFVRWVEDISDTCVNDLDLPDVAMMMCHNVVVFDHAQNLIRVIALADPTEEGYRDACHVVQSIVDKLARPLPPLPSEHGTAFPVESNMTQSEYEAAVIQMKEYISAGDGIQFVPSQRFKTRCDAHPITVYRSLRSLNPSPYMFLLRFGDFDVVGASPELLVGLQAGVARVRPIAGTRWRGKTVAEDEALATELLADEKERAEHIMLVDLGRNDVGRVSEWGSVTVNELMVIERYSHVMHIVSDVTGRLRKDLSPWDLIRATFPAGTVTGAPKVRAMQIIDELEPTRRGLYAGAVGYVSATGDLDLAIALRSVVMKGGYAYIQAGAGIVHDSDPSSEYRETWNKARAPLLAVEQAQTGEYLAR